jgi:hypothetical protein
MANDKIYDRHVNIWINGKEVTNDISSIKKEMFNLTNELGRTTRGTKEYYDKAKELRYIKEILKEHQDSISATRTSWDKLKEGISGSIGKITAFTTSIYGAFEAVKGILMSTEGSSDKLNEIIAGGKEMFWQFQNQIANLDFSNFFANLKEAYNRGKELEQQLDELADTKAFNDYRISSLNRESRALQETTKNLELDIKVRAAAAEKRKTIEEEIQARTVDLANRAFEIEKSTWEGKNKMVAEEAVKLYEVIDQISVGNRKKLEGVFQGAVAGQLGDVNQGIKSVLFGQSGKEELKGIDPEVIKSYGDYFRLLQKGEAEVLPKLFNSFKNIEEATAEAQVRMNAFIKESSGIFNKESKASGTVSVEGDTSGLEDAITGVFQTDLAYNPDTYVQDEEKARLALEKELNDQRVADNKETQDEINKTLVEGANQGLEDFKKRQIEEKKLLDEKVQSYLEFGAKIGEQLGQAMADGNMTAREAAKELIKIALDELGNHATIAIAAATIGSLTQPDSIFTFGAMGVVRAAILTGLIKAAVGAAKGVISKNLDTGGYTGEGGIHEVAGLVHKGEWVAPAWMVAEPQTGSIIKALEHDRTNNLSGYAKGGGPGISSSGSGAGGSGSTIFGSDPEMKALMRDNRQLLNMLLTEGVKNNYTYKDVDNLDYGLKKLENIKKDVSL